MIVNNNLSNSVHHYKTWVDWNQEKLLWNFNRPHYLVFPVFLILLSGCQAREPTQAERASSVGTEASIVAMQVVSASRKCQIIGATSLETCAKNTGQLLQELIARTYAELAIGQRAGYWSSCPAHFGWQYCQSLLERAIVIEANTPESP